MQQRGRVVGDLLVPARRPPAPADAVARGARAELARGALGQDAAVLDDRHAVGQCLRLVEVVRGEQDRLAEVAQRAHDVPGVAPRGGVEAGRRLVEEDQLRVADQRQREVQPPPLAAAERARALPGDRPPRPARAIDLARRRAARGTATPSARPPRAP